MTFEDIAGIFKDVQYYVVEETIHSADADGQYHSYSPTCTLNGTSVTVQPVSEADGVYVYRSEPMKLNISTRSENARSATTNLIGFTNHVEESKLGVLRITKKIKEGANISADSVFDVRVKLGGAPLPVGTAYKLYNVDLSAYELKYVTEKGIVSLKAEQTVVIERILSTSTVEVTELAHNASPSYATNTPTAITCAQNGAFGTMPLGGDVTITITNDDGTGLMVDKTVAKGDADDKFNLTLEAFGTGETSSFVSTKPADIVLVLDQSASMYTPKGASKDRFDKWAEQRYTAGLEPLEAGSLDPEKAKHTGYYVAQPKAYNQQLRESEEGVDYDGDGQIEAEARIYDWMIVQYAEYNGQWGWYYIRVEDTTTPVSFDFANATLYDHDSLNQYGMTLYASDDRGLSSDFIYFQSQYGSLYDSVNDFVTDLNAQASANKVNHRVAIVGFSGPYYDAMNYYNGTGIYIDGSYYLYDNDYMHKGKYVDGVLVQDNVNGTVILDPDAGYKQWPFKPVAADKSEYDFVGIVEGNENRYASAFVDISTEAGLQSVAASINAIKTNYMQTCPAIGIRIARSIFKGEEIKLNDPGLANSSTTAAQLINAANPGAVPVSDRDQIIILFTDGVPTVSMYSDHDDAISKNAEIYNEYWTGNAGVRDAINEANAAKSEGVKIYTIGTAAASKKYGNLGDAKDANTSAGDNRIPFLDLVSSNYPEASSVYDVVPVSDDNMGVSAYNFTVDYGTKAEDADFALSASQNSDLTVVFGTIMESITLPTVKLDGNAVLKEYLSDYFDLDAVDTGEIQVYVAPYAGVNDKGEHTFGDRVLASEKGFTIEVTFDSYGGRNDVVVNVKGFNYSQNYVRQDPDTQELLGYKLIVVVPIKARDGFWGGNNVPTNKDITAIYDDKGNEVQDFPMPEVNVPMQPVVTTQDQVIYYGDSTIGPEDILTGVTVDGYAVKYDPTLGKFVPGDLTSDADDWMDDYAVLKWSAGSSTMDTPVSSVTSKDYTFGVTLTPLPGHAGRENLSINGSNIAGDPVPMTGTSDHSTGHVDILVPVLTFQDSTIEIGDVTDKAYYDTTNYVDTIIWVNMENPYDGNGEPIEASPSDPDAAEPVLTVTYASISDYTNYGPNNELYLASGQAVAFVLNKHSAQQVHMAMKSVGGTAKVKIYAASAGVNVDDLESLEIATAMDLYYDLTDYKDGSTVVIVNSGTEDDAILSITNVKTTYGESDSGEQTRDYTMNPSAAAIVLKTLGAVQAAAPTLTPSYPTVAFEDEICYNIYFDLENGDGLTVNDMGLMSWYSKPENIRYEDAEYVVSGVSFNESAGKYVARSQGIPAKNLADDLYFVVYAKLSDGSYVYSELYRYNAKAYAEDILANSTNQKMKALCVAMLNYGAEAQVYFDHNTDSLMNADLTAEQQALVSDYRTDMIDALIPVDNTKAEQFNSNFGGYSDAYPSVSFLGAFSINFYFVPANTPDSGMTFYYWDEATYESVDILTVENATGVVELTEADGLYAASCEDISAKQIDETVFVCGVYESNGVRYSTGVLNYSIGAYCLDRIANGNADMQAFAEATAVYGYYAKSYFNIV